MNNLKEYIIEKLVIGNNLDKGYKYFPKNKYELMDCINKKVNKEGLGTKDKPLDLNDIDTSKITDMSDLFDEEEIRMKELSHNGYFDISGWDVSNVTNMEAMFYYSTFNGDISEWDVGKVKKMRWMFSGSNFDGDISDWDVSNVEYMDYMFSNSLYTAKNGDISKWNIKNVKSARGMFDVCPLRKHPPKWYKKVNS